MAMTGSPEHFARLLEYEVRCTELVLASLKDAQRTVEELSLASLAAPFERAVAIFCHVQAARMIWLHRLDPALAAFPEDGLFPIWPLRLAESRAREMDRAWEGFAQKVLPGADLGRAVRYRSTEGVEYESTASDILTHLVNHSTYHRGQIANLVAATGTKPAVTDFIALTRRTM